MSPEAKARLNKFNAEQSDWYTTCPKCGAKIVGTLCDMSKHDCELEQPERKS